MPSRLINIIGFCALSGLLLGCGEPPREGVASPRRQTRAKISKKDSSLPKAPAETPRRNPAPKHHAPGNIPTSLTERRPPAASSASPPESVAGAPENSRPKKQAPADRSPPPRLLGEMLSTSVDSAMRMLPHLPRRKIDDARAAAAAVRKLSSRRLTLYTDLSGAEIDRLPELFDEAFPQWCAYFHVDPAKHADWNMTGFLMGDKERFVRTGFLPRDLPPFPHGYSRNFELWLYEQPSDYYRRHLLVHEGTHGFMNTILGSCGPPWYMEGMAELLATHALRDGKLLLNYFPQHREEVPQWGRIRIVQDAVAARRATPLDVVLAYPPAAYHETSAYAWSWAAAALMDRHPRYQARFRQLYQWVLDRRFQRKFDELFAADHRELFEEWQVFLAGMEYGYDVPRMAIDFRPGRPLPPGGANAAVAVDRGWQNSGYRLEGGRTYQLTASGRWQKRCRPECWPGFDNLPEKIAVEPGGVSIRYYHGQPLGKLLAAVRSGAPESNQPSVFLAPLSVGLAAEITPRQSGTLYLRVNDSAAELRDNQGEIRVEIFDTYSRTKTGEL